MRSMSDRRGGLCGAASLASDIGLNTKSVPVTFRMSEGAAPSARMARAASMIGAGESERSTAPLTR